MAYYAHNGEETFECKTLDEALSICREAIKYARDNCDPEWPNWVSDIRIKEGPAGLADWEDRSALPVICRAVEANIIRPSSPLDDEGYDDQGEYWGDGCEYRCDYEMRAALEQGARRG